MKSDNSSAPRNGDSAGMGRRLLYVKDVQALLGNRKSPWWIKRNFAPHYRFKIGRDSVWYADDANRWLDEQRGAK